VLPIYDQKRIIITPTILNFEKFEVWSYNVSHWGIFI